MSVSGISNSVNNYYIRIASGKRINSAADDAAGLAIAKELETQSSGYEVGSNNASAGQDLLKVAEGGLSNIMDSLQRMRELSVQASNTAIYGPSELNAIQSEIDQLKGSISDIAKNTQFNGMNLLDGSKSDWNIAINANGGSTSVDTPNATLEVLGINDYNVANSNFDMNVLDEAISKISEAMSSIGASSNGLQHQINYNNYASYNLIGAQSRIEDLDIPKAVSEKEKQRIFEEYRMMLMKKQMENESKVNKLLQF